VESQSISGRTSDTFSGKHQSSMLAEPPGSTSSSDRDLRACRLDLDLFRLLAERLVQASTVYLPGGTFSILALPLPSVTPKNGFGMTATHPSIQLCTSQVSLMNPASRTFPSSPS